MERENEMIIISHRLFAFRDCLWASPWIANENSARMMNSLPLEGKAQRRGEWGTGGMKVREDMRIKQAIHGSTRAPVFVNDDARK